MAFTQTQDGDFRLGNRRITFGSFTNGAGDSGGDILTGLLHIENFLIMPKGSSVAGNQCVVDETFPLAVDGVTIVTDAGVDGYWMAIGY